jgi:hypothetical protein
MSNPIIHKCIEILKASGYFLVLSILAAGCSTVRSSHDAHDQSLPPYSGVWSGAFDSSRCLLVIDLVGLAQVYLANNHDIHESELKGTGIIEERDGKLILRESATRYHDVVFSQDKMTVLDSDSGGIRAAFTRIHYNPEQFGSWRSQAFTGSLSQKYNRIDLDLAADGAFSLLVEGREPLLAKGVYLPEGNSIQLVGMGASSFITAAHFDGETMRLIIGDGAAILAREELGQASSDKQKTDALWATIGVSEPLVAVGRLQSFCVHFGLVNDTNHPVDIDESSWRLFINGKLYPESQFMFMNGPRYVGREAMLPGEHLAFTYAIRDVFSSPGIYTLVWQGRHFRSQDVTFRVLKSE